MEAGGESCPFSSATIGVMSHRETSWISTAIALVVITSSTIFMWRALLAGRRQRAPGPVGWPVLGSVLEIKRNFHRMNDWYLSYFSDQVKTFSVVVLAFPRQKRYITTVDPVNVEHILTNIHMYGKGRGVEEILGDFLGTSLVVSDGDLWKRHRRIASAEFSSRKAREHSDTVFRECAMKLANVLKRAMDADEPVECQGLFLRMTFDSICKVAFGVDLGGLSPSLPDVPLARAFDAAQVLVLQRVLNPLFKLQRALDIGAERRLREAIRDLDLFAEDVISKRREEISAAHVAGKPFEKDDLLSKFMEHKNEVVEDRFVNNRELRDVVISFLLAGRDTTAITLAWFVYEMCLHPEIAAKIYEEGVQMVGKHTEFETMVERLTHQTLGKMHYLQAALSESLRLHPPVPRDVKFAFVDDVLPDGTQVKKGDLVQYMPYSMGRMPFLWGSDALEIKPERWLKDGVFHNVSPFKFSVFQAGPRICLGRDSAYMQLKLTMALIIHFFTFQLVPGQEITYSVTLVMPMKNGVKVILSPRK